MAVLTKKEILNHITQGDIAFTPSLDRFQIQPHAVDLRLGKTFKIPKTWQLTEKGRESLNVDYLTEQKKENFEIITLEKGQYFDLLPNEFIIVSTLESIVLNTDHLMAVLYPRTTINRRGLSVNLSGIIDVGYKGSLIIPICNDTTHQTIRLYPGERFCQVVFYELTQAVSPEEQLQHGLAAPKYHQIDENENESKPDNFKETDFIRSGELEKLKKDFSL